ncbi:PhaM family polyhydroxyalkanoate granule multifunctional regulatory protein [Azovibrio restrictus]|uniref:PhaM family polyhydroxyalkanoate granule multifunctional regulatory protein n=1 Tax=Azovibrio restrictus TaxID=146938 RepID=UPI0004175D36|nr:PhaM family polyhydroxyalkanoate granule multifunctional regulatory protein [Azovibrio restrictus]MCE1170884.1 hypothetical protein [Azovibrio sp.]
MANEQTPDPMEFVRQMWGNMGFSLPGMVTPTFDTDELEKRITDLKAVEGWLRMNLSMLQMTIQGLEMQKATLTAVQAMGKMSSQAAAGHQPATPQDGPTVGETLQQAALWPWNLMQQMQDQLQDQLQQGAAANPPPPAAQEAPKAAAKKTKKDGS